MSYTLEFQNIIWTKPPFLGLKSSFSRQKYFIKTPRLPSTTQEPCDLMIIQMKGNQRTDFTPPTGIFITMFEGVLEITLAKTTNDFLGAGFNTVEEYESTLQIGSPNFQGVTIQVLDENATICPKWSSKSVDDRTSLGQWACAGSGYLCCPWRSRNTGSRHKTKFSSRQNVSNSHPESGTV